MDKLLSKNRCICPCSTIIFCFISVHSASCHTARQWSTYWTTCQSVALEKRVLCRTVAPPDKSSLTGRTVRGRIALCAALWKQDKGIKLLTSSIRSEPMKNMRVCNYHFVCQIYEFWLRRIQREFVAFARFQYVTQYVINMITELFQWCTHIHNYEVIRIEYVFVPSTHAGEITGLNIEKRHCFLS